MTLTAGITMVRDEADVIEGTIRAMARELDLLVVADNLSTDGTAEILRSLEADLPQLVVEQDAEVGYYQARKMTRLADVARSLGAEWVVPFDADERWYSPFGRIGDVLARIDPDVSIVSAELYDHVATAEDPDGPPFQRMGWRRREPAALPKVAARTRPSVRIHQGNHGADYGGTVDGLLVVRHYPYRSAAQFVRKARNGAEAYAATDLPESAGQHWRDYGRILEAEGPEALEGVFRQWFWVAAPRQDPALIWDPAPVR